MEKYYFNGHLIGIWMNAIVKCIVVRKCALLRERWPAGVEYTMNILKYVAKPFLFFLLHKYHMRKCYVIFMD